MPIVIRHLQSLSRHCHDGIKATGSVDISKRFKVVVLEVRVQQTYGFNNSTGPLWETCSPAPSNLVSQRRV